MSYKSFKNISEVCEKFNLKYEKKSFVKTKKFVINKYLYSMLDEFFIDNCSFASETSISERIIFPIIYAVSKHNELSVWSQLRFNVDKKLKLTGNPDYILAPALEGRKKYKFPVVCLGKAKKKDFDEGWGQVGAEMVAAQIANKNKKIPILGLVTDGIDWEFGKLIENKITINKSKIVATEHLQKLFNTLNWMFAEAHKNAEQLLLMFND